MLFFPQVQASNASRDFVEVFGGLNHSIRTGENEFYDMKNMTADYYPVLSPRKKRSVISELSRPQGMICKDALCYINDGELFINGNKVLSGLERRQPKQLVSMGAYIVIFPDGYYINTENTSDRGFIDNEVEIDCSEQTVTYWLCTADGTEYQTSNPSGANYLKVSTEAPDTTNLPNGYKWLDISGDVHYIKVWSSTTHMWTALSTTYVKIESAGIGDGFKEGDAVTISGTPFDDINTSMLVKGVAKNNSWILVTAIIDEYTTQTSGTVKIDRSAPKMDFVVEHNNRLWGCRYGFNKAGKTVNEIYACKQGDFTNWFCYAGISTDSYAVSLGSDGLFTGAVAYGSYILFFKENCIHKVYGTMPSNYQVIEQKVRGVQRGSEKSICTVDEVLYYKSTTEVCCYDGSLPIGISNNLGEDQFTEAVAGTVGGKYYICMKNTTTNKHEIYVYDSKKQMWHKEDNKRITEFCKVDDQLYFLDSKNRLGTMSGGTEDDFDWYAETGCIGFSQADNKYVGRVLIRLTKPITSKVKVLIAYDDSTEFKTVADIDGNGTRSYSIPIIPHRCDHFKLRIEGTGEAKIYSISKVLEIGSDV